MYIQWFELQCQSVEFAKEKMCINHVMNKKGIKIFICFSMFCFCLYIDQQGLQMFGRSMVLANLSKTYFIKHVYFP